METISLELAKKFKDAGIEFKCKNKYIKYKHFRKTGRSEKIVIYRPTAEEIRARLPESKIVIRKNNTISYISECRIIWKDGDDVIYVPFEWPTLAEALGNMYLYFFKNWLIWKN